MGRALITLDDLTATGRRVRVLRHLAGARRPLPTNAVMRSTALPPEWGDAERQRVRSALRDLRAPGWVDRGDDGWVITALGRQILAAVDARPIAA